MNEPSFVIVGTGRSGSGYIARVLTEAGVRCGHEAWWNPHGTQEYDLVGDSSWCALALGLHDYRGQVFHQVRHPLDVVSSLAKTPTHGEYRNLQLRLMGADPWNALEWAMLACHTYLEAAVRCSRFEWRLEDVNTDLVIELGQRIGCAIDPELAAEAVRSVDRTNNRHGEGHRYDWVELPVGYLRDALMGWAARWGWT